MRVRTVNIAAILIVVAFFALTVADIGVPTKAQPRYKWTYSCFNTLDSMMQTMNSLSANGSPQFQLVTVPSSRNYGGLLGDPYCIVYQK